MVKFITLGSFDYRYKYMIFYIIIMLPLEYFLGEIFPDDVKIKYLRFEYFPKDIFVYEFFKYFGIFIFGLIVKKIEIESFFKAKKDSNIEKIESLHDMELIYKNQRPTFSLKGIIFLICFYTINLKLLDLFYIFYFSGIDFWTIEIVFIVAINIMIFKIQIYIHKKIAIIIILFFSSLMKIISIIFIYKSDEKRLYKEYGWLFPIGFFSFILFFFVDAYALCKMKWYFNLKFISEKVTLISFGFFGIFLYFLCSIISHSFECKSSEFASYICIVYKDEQSPKYVDNFNIFFKNIWKENRESYINFIYAFLLLLKIFLSAFRYLFSFLIIKELGPEYLICSDSILYFITKIISFIYYLATNKLKEYFTFDLLAQFFSLLGTIIYLELIELNFCGLSYNTKKNINFRAGYDCTNINNEDIYSITSDGISFLD